MVVPARPVEGAPVDVAWGGIAHDTAVAQDIQSGTFTHTTGAAGAPGAASVVTFARPFAGVPVVILTGVVSSAICLPDLAAAPTTGGFQAVARRTDGGATTTFTIHWIAIGPRA